MRIIITSILILYCCSCISQKQTLPKVYIVKEDFQEKGDTLANGSSIFIIQNIDGEFLTSVALLYYFKTDTLLVSSKNVNKNLIKYEDLISTIKNNKQDFFEKYQYYLVEPKKDGNFKAFKVYLGRYFEDKDKSGLDILSDF